MKPSFYRYCFALLWLMLCVLQTQAQVCRNYTATLNADGTYILKDQDVVYPPHLSEDHIVITPRTFTCENIGDNPIDILIYKGANDFLHCTAVVTIRDNTPPDAKCFSDFHVVLNGRGEHVFTPQAINWESSDACGGMGVRFFPDRVTCRDPNPLTVHVVARDPSGNLDTCHMNVTWDPYAGIVEPISCRDSVIITLDDELEIRLTPEMVLKEISYGCGADYTIELSDGIGIRPEPLVTFADSNTILTVTVKDEVNDIECSSVVRVRTNLFCWKPFLICDTVCHATPVGDCTTGHTLYDEVEWPCDLEFHNICPSDYPNPSPENLLWKHLADETDIRPEIGFESCLFVGVYDIPTEFPIHKLIERYWTVLDWGAQTTYEYVQTITLRYDLTEICDTQPWSAPVTDCAGGHSSDDDVEWPADFTVESLFTSPDQLALNSTVDPNNVRPRLMTECTSASVTYADQVTEISDTELLIERTWQIQDLSPLQTWQYVQRITVLRNEAGSLVCVTREHGQPIPLVQLVPDSLTDVTGCFYFKNPNGVVVTPVRDSPLEDGVNVHDQIAIREYLLGIRSLSQYELYAADVTQDGEVNAADIHAIDQIIAGTFVPPFAHTWKFYQVVTNAASADITNTSIPYTFIGIKIGDVVTADGEEIIYLVAEDEALNAGEIYEIPFYLDRDELIRAIGLNLISPENQVEFLSIEAPQFPGFGAGNVNITDDFLRILWLANGPHFDQGAQIEKDEPILIIRLQSNENTTLHEAIAIGDGLNPEFIPPFRAPYMIRLYWDEGIVSSSLDLADGRQLLIYPNPVTNEFLIHGLEEQEEGVIMMYNMLGQQVLRTPVQSSVDVSMLQEGMYFMTLFIDGRYSKAVSVVKVKG